MLEGIINMKDLDFYLQKAVKNNATDIFIIAGKPVSARIDREIVPIDDEKLKSTDTVQLIEAIYTKAYKTFKSGNGNLDEELAFSVQDLSRFRVSVFKQKGSPSAVLKVLGTDIPTAEKLGIPEKVMSVADMTRGLVLLSGAPSNGISSTLAAIIDRMNKTRQIHIITIEETIEFVYKSDKAIISQRELTSDTFSYMSAIKASMRQSPDVVVLNSFKNNELVDFALDMAEIGYLVIATVQRLGAVNTINQVINQFPEEEEAEIALKLSNVIRAVVSQQLIPTTDNRIIPAFDMLIETDELRKAITDKDFNTLNKAMLNTESPKIMSMNHYLEKLLNDGVISQQTYRRKKLNILK